MATKFITLNGDLKTINKKTVFTKGINGDFSITNEICLQPKDWDNVLYLGHDKDYGDVFKAWDDGNEEDFVLFFGKKGDEFDS